MKKNIKFFNLFLLLVISTTINAQCPAIVVSNTAVSPASCPSGGSISITATGNQLQYFIASGPSGYLATSNSTGIFTSLNAGSYTIRITDQCGVIRDVSGVVNNTYPTFTVSSTSITNSCTAFTPGGTLNANITGGKPPFQYDIVPIGSTPSYGSNTTNTTYSENVTTFGNYRVYAKDACGEVRTMDIEFTKTQDKPYFWWTFVLFDRPCGETIDGLNSASLILNLFDENGYGYNASSLIGARVKIYRPATPNSITSQSNNCTTPTSTLISNFLVSSANLDAFYTSGIKFPISRQDLVIHIETLCGDTAKFCYDYNDGVSDSPYVNANVIQRSCNATWSAQTINVKFKDYFGLTPPLTFTLIRANSTQTTNSTGDFSALPTSTFPATYRVTDACGRQINNALNLPVQGSALSASIIPNWNYECTNAKNAVSANIAINSGDLQGILQATNITITGGPASVIPSIGGFDDWLKGYTASNLIAGYTYKVLIVNNCGEKDSIQFVMPADNLGQAPLNWNLVLSKNQLCGSNTGSITAASNYTGSISPNYYLFNLLNPNVVLQSNNTGDFTNLSPGNYKVKFVADISSYHCPDYKISDSATISIIDENVGQSITRKTIFNCESAGTPTGQGKAIVEVNGSGPFSYEIIKTNLIGSGSEVWNTSSVNNVNDNFTWDLPLLGDPVNTIYTLRSTDKCGNKITTIASLQPLGAAGTLNDIQPCVGEMNYTFGINKFAGSGFTYRWVKLPNTATTIGTEHKLTIAGAYDISADGNYRLYVSYGSCIDREYNFTLNNSECGKTLPILIHEFSGREMDNTIELQWRSQQEEHLKYYIIERSTDGLFFETIDKISIKENRSILNRYTYKDPKLPLSITKVYYRLKLVSLDERINYSTILKFDNGHNFVQLNLAPNPIKVATVLNFKSEVSGVVKINIYDQTGNIVDRQSFTSFKGYNSIQMIPNVMQGVYILEFINGAKNVKTKLVKL